MPLLHFKRPQDIGNIALTHPHSESPSFCFYAYHVLTGFHAVSSDFILGSNLVFIDRLGTPFYCSQIYSQLFVFAT